MNIFRSRVGQNEGKLDPIETKPVDGAPIDGAKSEKTSEPEGELFPEKGPPKPRRMLQSFGASLLAKAGAVAVGAAILGTMLGAPQASNRVADGPPMTQVVYEQPTGTEVSHLTNALSKVTGALAPLGVSEQEVVDALDQATLSIELDGGRLLEGELEIQPGTRLSINLRRNGVTISARPAMTWTVDYVADPEVRSLTYDFDSGTFHADAEGLGPDGLYEYAVESAATSELKGLMPPAMQRPGYDPWTDPDLERNVQGMVDLLKGSDVSEVTGQSAVSSPRLSMWFTAPRTMRFDLPDCDYSAWLEAGTRIQVSLALDGAVDDPHLEGLHIRFAGHPVEVSKGEERDAILNKMDVHGIHVLPGGDVELDYDLGTEQAEDGFRALVTLLAVAAEPRLAGEVHSMPRSRHDALRERVQDRIDEQVEPALADLVRAHDDAIPGVSLLDVIGIDQPQP